MSENRFKEENLSHTLAFLYLAFIKEKNVDFVVRLDFPLRCFASVRPDRVAKRFCFRSHTLVDRRLLLTHVGHRVTSPHPSKIGDVSYFFAVLCRVEMPEQKRIFIPRSY